MTSEKLQKARDFEAKYTSFVPAEEREESVGLTIPTVSRFIKGSTICFSSTTHIPTTGDPCTGAM